MWSGEEMRQVRVDPPTVFDVGGKRVEIERWTVAQESERLTDNLPPRDGLAEDATAYYSLEPLVGSSGNDVGCLLPFARVEIDGSSFSDAFVNDEPIETEAIGIFEWRRRNSGIPQSLARYVYLRLGLSSKIDNVQTHLCGLDRVDGVWKATVGPGVWSGARSSMDAGLVRIEVRDGDSPELQLLSEALVARFGAVPVREAMQMGVVPDMGNVPPFGAGHNQYSLGVCSQFFCEGDGKFLATRRGRGVHINAGLVCAASGAVPWSCVDLDDPDLFHAVDAGMALCNWKEIGKGDFRIVRTGFARDLTRQGSPEFFYTVYFSGTSEEAVQIIAANDDSEAEQIDGYVYAFTPEIARRLLASPDGTRVVQRKGMVNLLFSLQHLGR